MTKLKETLDQIRFDILRGYSDSKGLHPKGINQPVSLENLLQQLEFKDLGSFIGWYRSFYGNVKKFKKDWCKGNCCQSLSAALLRETYKYAELCESQKRLKKSAKVFEDLLYVMATIVRVAADKKFGTETDFVNKEFSAGIKDIYSEVDFYLDDRWKAIRSDKKFVGFVKKRDEFMRLYVRKDGMSVSICRKLSNLHKQLGHPKKELYWSEQVRYILN